MLFYRFQGWVTGDSPLKSQGRIKYYSNLTSFVGTCYIDPPLEKCGVATNHFWSSARILVLVLSIDQLLGSSIDT